MDEVHTTLENLRVQLYTMISFLINGLSIFFKIAAVAAFGWLMYYAYIKTFGSMWDSFWIKLIPWS